MRIVGLIAGYRQTRRDQGKSFLHVFEIDSKIFKSNLWWGAYQPVFIRIALMIHNAMVVAEGIYQVDTLATVFYQFSIPSRDRSLAHTPDVIVRYKM